MRRLSSLAVTLLTGLLVWGCGSESPALAVDGVEYAPDDLLGLSSGSRGLLVGITAVGLAHARGEARVLSEPVLARERREALVERLADEITVRATGAGEEALRAHYLTNPEYELTVRHLVFLAERWESDQVRTQAEESARKALERARSGEPFPDLAAELSEEPGADRRGGLLEPGREGSWVPEFWQAASALQEGEASDVVETRYGFHVLKLEKRDTVPFQEARPGVVSQVAELVGDRRAWQSWADSAVAARLELQTDVVKAHLEGREHAPPDSVALASWGDPGGLSVAEFEWFLASLPADETEAARRGDLDKTLELVDRAARTALLAQVAEERGLHPPESRVQSTARAWEDRVVRWGSRLGFRPGMSQDEVKAAALEGLGSTSQGARITRDELREWLPLLRTAYPVREETSDSTSP